MDTLNKIETRKKHKNMINNSRTRADRKEAQKQYNEIHKEVRRHQETSGDTKGNSLMN